MIQVYVQRVRYDIQTEMLQITTNKQDVVDTTNGPKIKANYKDADADDVNVEVHLQKDVLNEYKTNDPDYSPIEQSDTDDYLEDNELLDDEEYIEAR